MARPAAILFAISLVILTTALFLAGSNVLLMRRSQSAVATYVDSVSRVGGNHGGTFLHARFAFQSGRGRPIQKVISTAGSTSEGYAPGDTVRVYYEAAHPEQAKLATFWDMWIGPTLSAIVGLFLLCLAASMLIIARRVAPAS
jgi:hypothetical protein